MFAVLVLSWHRMMHFDSTFKKHGLSSTIFLSEGRKRVISTTVPSGNELGKLVSLIESEMSSVNDDVFKPIFSIESSKSSLMVRETSTALEVIDSDAKLNPAMPNVLDDEIFKISSPLSDSESILLMASEASSTLEGVLIQMTN